MRTVKIQYGIFGGELQGKRLRREIQKAGYAVTKNASAADIILAHSAGCFWLPSAPARQKLLLVDPPYWPAKSIGERGKARAKRNFQFRQYG